MPHIVALIGMDGSGKTTQARMLVEWLCSQAAVAVYWQNAGGRRWFGRLAARCGRRDALDLIGPRAMMLVETVLRWLSIARALVWSGLAGGIRGQRIAVMDRYSFCQYASIRAHRGRRERLTRLTFGVFPRPVVTCYLRVSPERAYSRIERRGTDHEDLEYLTTVDRAYRELAEAGEFVIIEADGTVEQVHERVRHAVMTALTAEIPSLAKNLSPS